MWLRPLRWQLRLRVAFMVIMTIIVVMDTAPPPDNGVWTLELLTAAEAAGHRLKFVLFWGHTGPKSGEVGKHVFSQWHESPFTIDRVVYPSAEHYMMAAKARLFNDAEHLEQILQAKSPAEAKKLGRSVQGFDPQTWDANALDIVTRGSVAKFDARDQLRSYLVGTGDRVLVEASPHDRIWGIGMDRNDPAAEQPSQWQGQNLLGLALMRARAELRAS